MAGLFDGLIAEIGTTRVTTRIGRVAEIGRGTITAQGLSGHVGLGDRVTIASPALGALVNEVQHCDTIAPWQFGVRALYASLLASQQGQTKARRAVALIDLNGDGTPEMVQLASTGGESRTCRLSVYTVKSGEAVPVSASGFGWHTTIASG